MRLLLDAHIGVAVARGLREIGIDAVAMGEWLGAEYRTTPDEEILRRASEDGRVLVTFDLRTIPPLLKRWSETATSHAGVILIDQKTLRPANVGGLIRAIRDLRTPINDSWQNCVVFLSERPPS